MADLRKCQDLIQHFKKRNPLWRKVFWQTPHHDWQPPCLIAVVKTICLVLIAIAPGSHLLRFCTQLRVVLSRHMHICITTKNLQISNKKLLTAESLIMCFARRSNRRGLNTTVEAPSVQNFHATLQNGVVLPFNNSMEYRKLVNSLWIPCPL